MGRVFSWEEICLGHVPELSSFDLVGQMLREELTACLAIIGALFCGSFRDHDHNRRSDIDCVMLYELKRRLESMEVRRRLVNFAHKLHITLELIPIDVELASRTIHHAASTFIDHLLIASRDPKSVIKENPVRLLYYNPDDFRQHTIDYLKHKISRFEKGEHNLQVMSSVEWYRILEKAVALPIYAARKVLRCFGEEFTRGDSKKEILRIYLSLPGMAEAKEILEESMILDQKYTKEVERQILQKDEMAYRAILKEFEDFIPKAFAFTRMNLFLFDQP